MGHQVTRMSVLLYPKCPTGKHVGSVLAYTKGFSGTKIPWPLQYDCGCVEDGDV